MSSGRIWRFVSINPSSILNLKQQNVKVHSSWKAWHAKCKGSFILESMACKCSYQHVTRRKNLTCLICKSQVMFAALFCAQTDLACCNGMMRWIVHIARHLCKWNSYSQVIGLFGVCLLEDCRGITGLFMRWRIGDSSNSSRMKWWSKSASCIPSSVNVPTSKVTPVSPSLSNGRLCSCVTCIYRKQENCLGVLII